MAQVNDWDIVDANNNATPPDGWPENTMQYSEVNNTGRQVQGAVRRMWGDLNGSLQAGGVADAYTVTLNSAYTAYFAGMYFACEINAVNTGASTIDVNGLGAQAIVQRDGSALPGGILDSGGIYEFRYDGTNFQLMGTIGGDVAVAQATLTNSNQIDLVDTDVALRVGAADPDTAQHMEIDLDGLQSKSDATTAAAMSINPFGGEVQIGAQSGLGGTQFYDDGNFRMSTAANSILVRSDDNGDPTVPDNITLEISLRSQDGNEFGEISYNAGSVLRIFNRAHGGDVRLQAEDLSGVGQILFNGDPDGGAGLYFNGELTLFTQDHGVQYRGTVAGAVPQNYNTFVELANGDGTAVIGTIGFDSAFQDSLNIRSLNHGRNVNVWAEDAGGTGRQLGAFDPDGLRFQVPQEVNGAIVAGPTNGATSPLGSSADADHSVRAVSTTAGDQAGFQAYVNDTVRNWRAFFGVHDNDLWGIAGSGSSGLGDFRVQMNGEDALGATPGGGTYLYSDNILRLITQAGGTVAVRSDGNTDTEGRKVDFENQDGTLRGFVGHNGSDVFQIQNRIHGGNLLFIAEDAGGVSRTIIEGNPDDDVAIFDDGTEVARTLPAASGGFEVNNTLTGAGFERVLTTGDLGGGIELVSATASANVERTNQGTTIADPDLDVDIDDDVWSAELCIGWLVTTDPQGFRMNMSGTLHSGITTFNTNAVPSTGTMEFGVLSGTVYVSANFVNQNTNYYMKGTGIAEGLSDPDTVTFNWGNRLTNGNLTRRLDGSWMRYIKVGT